MFSIPAWLSYVSCSIDICTEAIRNIRNIHAVSINHIALPLHSFDKCYYNLQEIMKVGSQQTFVLMKTSFVFVFRRRLHQDEYIRLNHSSSEDVFKTSSRGLDQDQYIRLG